MKDKSDNTHQTQSAADTTVSSANPKVIKTKKGAKGPVVVTALVAILMAGGAVWYTQNHQQQLSHQYDAQLQLLVQQAQKNEQTAQHALTQVQNQSQQVQRLQTQLGQALAKLNDVSTALQTISDSGTEVMLLNDIEQLTALAQQQLQVGGNVANAIISLETAQARLTQANRQNFAVLLQAINGDLGRLRTVQVVDIATLSTQLDRLAELVTQAPLYIQADSTSSEQITETQQPIINTESVVIETSDELNPVWWQNWLNTAATMTQKGWDSVRHDLGQFISVRRIDDQAALLISPEQADRLREDLRLRITMAQLALMTKQPKVWHAELDFITHALEQRFDGSKAATQRALALATQLADTDIELQLPSLDNTQSVIENLKQGALESSPGVESAPASPSLVTESEPESEPDSAPERAPVPSSEPTTPLSDLPEDSVDQGTHTDASDHASAGLVLTQQVV